MTYLESIILGLVQGLGEFLPISSSAHLVIAPWLFEFADPGLAFDVALHFGTLVAVVAYFWRDWFEIAKGSLLYWRSKSPAGREAVRPQFFLLVYLVLATLPGAVAGVLLDDYAETSLRHPLLVSVNMVVLGGVLWLVDKRAASARRDIHGIDLKTALIIGASQALALFPGVSRSGITITAALLLGLSRTASARFSFLLSTPIIFGACLLKAKYLLLSFDDFKIMIGILTAGVSGFLSIKYLMLLVQNFSYRAFCYYRFAFGAGVFALYWMRR